MNKALSGSLVLAVLVFVAGCGGVHLPGSGPDLHSFKPRGLVLADVVSMASGPSQSTDFDTYKPTAWSAAHCRLGWSHGLHTLPILIQDTLHSV